MREMHGQHRTLKGIVRHVDGAQSLHDAVGAPRGGQQAIQFVVGDIQSPQRGGFCQIVG